MEYSFTLRYQLAESDSDMELLAERLGESGCDDALLGVGQAGRLALAFTREAKSARDAVHSALADVKKAVPSARLAEAVPDFVGLTDVAEIVGMSRQNMRKLMLAHAGGFPAPVHEGSASLWHLAEVLAWLAERGAYEWAAGLQELSQVLLEVNLAKEAHRYSPKVSRPLQSLVA